MGVKASDSVSACDGVRVCDLPSLRSRSGLRLVGSPDQSRGHTPSEWTCTDARCMPYQTVCCPSQSHSGSRPAGARTPHSPVWLPW